MELIQICRGAYLLRVPEAGVSWVFNAWPDITKFLIQQGLELNGIVYPDLRVQTVRGISCNLVEFPLLHAMFNQGMYARGERPVLVGTKRQLELAGESFRRGLYGFYDKSEMAGCDLSDAEMEALTREIEGLSLNGIQRTEELLELVPLMDLEENPGPERASEYNGLRIWKSGMNTFAVEYGGERIDVDINMAENEDHVPPFDLDVKNVQYKLYQIVDTGEEDGFSPKSCMHTLIQWRERIICVDLPMNVSYLLDKVSISRTEIDAVIFTHNHDDHIGELAMLMQMDHKVTTICPRIVWKSILLKAASMFDMTIAELEEYFDYLPVRYGEEIDYAGLRITAHPSIHSVPCAVYRIRGLVDQEWRVYSHMSDILNFARCRTLVKNGYLSEKRFAEYRDFLLEPASVKKIDIGARAGTEEFAVHGSWEDFTDDASETIILAHTREADLDPRATVMVGSFARAGSARDMSERGATSYHDKYRDRAKQFLGKYLFTLLEDPIEEGVLSRDDVRIYLRILADNEIHVIPPNTPFLKMGGESAFVDLVVSGVGSVWIEKEGQLAHVANVNAGDLIGDVGVLMEVPRTASIRADTYMHVLRIPGFLFREMAVGLGIFSERRSNGDEGVIQKIWRHREVVQGSRLFRHEVPIHLQNKLAQKARELRFRKEDSVFTKAGKEALVLAGDPASFKLVVDGVEVPEGATSPVFGEGVFSTGEPEEYDAVAQQDTIALVLDREDFAWMREVPIFKLRLKQLAEQRAIHVERARRRREPAAS